uniref:Protocadherin-1 n=1 Tax=Mesocestoides corti TaxID=53468 RepID=A0A5K3EF03_MESCO
MQKSSYQMVAAGRLVIVFLSFIHTGLCQRRLHAQFSLGDNTESGYRVGNLLANRPNSSPYGQEFLSTMVKPDEDFRVDINGDIITNHALDRDVLCGKLECCDRPICYMHVEAYFFTSSVQPLVFNVTFIISDENDNSPKFDIVQETLLKVPTWIPDHYRALPFLQLSVHESSKGSTKIILPLASDLDSPDFGISSYDLQTLHVNSTSSGSTFRLAHERPRSGPETLTLIAGRSLDREEQEEYWFILTALGNGSPLLSGSLLLRVQVDDINDHVPLFQNPPTKSGHAIELPENTPVGRVVYTFKAIDLDTGDNGKITYGIHYGSSLPRIPDLANMWALDPVTGNLSVAGVLDYENKECRKFKLTVLAKDAGIPSLTATATIMIRITDLNDNAPSIEAKSTGEQGGALKRFDIEENDNESRLIKLISVSDADSHSKDSISCSITNKDSGFFLRKYNPQLYGVVNSRAFDFEQDADEEGNLNVDLSCSDHAKPSLTSKITVKVRLRDLNDNWPQFEHQTYVFNVYEDVPVGSEIGRIIAQDSDSGPRGKLTYWLSADDPDDLKFVKIDKETGKLKTKVPLDREEKDILRFRVTAADGGSQDVRELDQIPRDSNANTTSLIIHLLDVNDNAPKYTGEKVIHVRENNEKGHVILDTLLFQDDDLGENGTVKFFLSDYDHGIIDPIIPPHSNGFFSIVNKKQLVLTESVDREQNPQFFIRILAVDGGKVQQLTGTTTLTIIIDDENDNYPELVHPMNASMLFGPSNHFDMVDDPELRHIPIDTPAGSLITTLRSRDMDAGENGRVSYHIRKAEPHELWFPTQQGSVRSAGSQTSLQRHKLVSDGCQYFRINKLDGHLKTAWLYGSSKDHAGSNSTEALPQAPSLGVHVIVIGLTDAGTPSLTTRVLLYVNISEATNTGLFGLSGFGFGEVGLGNTVILILIIVCSFALVISLTAAIFWVRLKVYSANPSQNQSNVINEVKYQAGCVAAYHDTILQEPTNGSLGYLKESENFAPLEGVRWSTPNVLDPLQYALQNPSNINLNDAGGRTKFYGKILNDCLESEVPVFPVLHSTENEGILVRGYDHMITGNIDQYEVCFPETFPPNLAHVKAGSTESDSGLDSGGYMVGQASSPSPEGAADHFMGTASELSVPSTFKPLRSRPYVQPPMTFNTVSTDTFRQTPIKQVLVENRSTTDFRHPHENLSLIPRDSCLA